MSRNDIDGMTGGAEIDVCLNGEVLRILPE